LLRAVARGLAETRGHHPAVHGVHHAWLLPLHGPIVACKHTHTHTKWVKNFSLSGSDMLFYVIETYESWKVNIYAVNMEFVILRTDAKTFVILQMQRAFTALKNTKKLIENRFSRSKVIQISID
jgi:hypothetical protein